MAVGPPVSGNDPLTGRSPQRSGAKCQSKGVRGERSAIVIRPLPPDSCPLTPDLRLLLLAGASRRCELYLRNVCIRASSPGRPCSRAIDPDLLGPSSASSATDEEGANGGSPPIRSMNIQ